MYQWMTHDVLEYAFLWGEGYVRTSHWPAQNAPRRRDMLNIGYAKILEEVTPPTSPLPSPNPPSPE